VETDGQTTFVDIPNHGDGFMVKRRPNQPRKLLLVSPADGHH